MFCKCLIIRDLFKGLKRGNYLFFEGDRRKIYYYKMLMIKFIHKHPPCPPSKGEPIHEHYDGTIYLISKVYFSFISRLFFANCSLIVR